MNNNKEGELRQPDNQRIQEHLGELETHSPPEHLVFSAEEELTGAGDQNWPPEWLAEEYAARATFQLSLEEAVYRLERRRKQEDRRGRREERRQQRKDER